MSSILKALAYGAVPIGAAGYAAKTNPNIGSKVSDFFLPEGKKIEDDFSGEGVWDKTKRISSNVANWEHTPKALAALALASALGYGTYKLGENNKMKELERAALGMR